jgi:hypothetical protein
MSSWRSFETIVSALCLFLAIDVFLLGQNHISVRTTSKGSDQPLSFDRAENPSGQSELQAREEGLIGCTF